MKAYKDNHHYYMYDVTFWPILAAGVWSMVFGYIWFHPKVFGTAWMRLANISPEAAEKGKKRMPYMTALGLLASMLAAYVMAYFGIAWGVYDWIGAMELGFWCWAGFVAPAMLGMVLWEGKSFKLYLITSLYWLLDLMVIAVILLY